MEKDIDEVGKIARNVKGKLEALNKDVTLDLLEDFPVLNYLMNSCILITSLLSRT